MVENRLGEVDLKSMTTGDLIHSAANKRYCCGKDGSPLFSPVRKNLKSYDATVVCKECGTRYNISENCESII
mgnify:FL=1